MARYEPIHYQGPDTTYKPPIGDLTAPVGVDQGTGSYTTGYADIDYLIEQLDRLITATKMMFTECERQLQDFALIVEDPNSDLAVAHKQAYPSDTTPGSVTFDEYKYLKAIQTTNATQYVISAYENAVRSPGGSNALDVSKYSLYVSNEAKRIKDFITNYIGEVDDTSEYRVIELFQDWTEEAVAQTKKFYQILAGTINATLPQEEIDLLSGDGASKSQALFRVKVNTANSAVNDLYSQFEKNWETTSELFYEKHLGPGLKFQLNVSRGLSQAIDPATMPVLNQHLTGSMMGLNSNYSRALADQNKRNMLFVDYTEQILANIVQRDTYASYIAQLGQVGTPLKKMFGSSSDIDQADVITTLPSLLDSYTSTASPVTNFAPSHLDLADYDSEDAHPQYLLRSGGQITGKVTLAAGASIDGVQIGTHRHTGSDGSKRISGSDIEYNSITDLQINNVDPTTEVPSDLEITAQVPFETITGDFKVSTEITFTVDESVSVAGYEFEIVKLG